MGYIGSTPTAVPLSGADILDDSIESADIKAGTIVNSDINASAAIVTSKVSGAVTAIASHGLATSATTDTTNAANISSGTIPEARIATLDATKLTGTVNNARISLDAAEIPSISTDKLTSGTIPDARLPSTALNSNVDLTTLSASNLTSGTLPDARFGALPAVSGVNLTALNGSNIGSGTVPTARLGSGTASSSTFLRGDSTYAAAGGGKVLKVTSHIHQAQETVNSTTFATVVTKAITLEESDSKLLIIWTMWVGIGSDTAASLRILRGSTDLTSTFGGNTGSGSIPNTFGPVSAMAGHAGVTYQPQNMSGNILDTPGGNVTYNFQIARTAGSGAAYLNRASYALNNGYHSKPASHTMFIEIAA